MQKVVAFTKTRNNSSPAGDSSFVRPANDNRTEGDARQTTEQIAVSIVIPTCGRPQLLGRCLAALVLQRFDPARFEIIVVDDRPSIGTRDVVIEWAKHAARSGPRISYLPSPGPHGPAAARNRGWRMARGPIIAFTDDDTVARTDWLEKGVQAFAGGEVDAVWGRIVMPLHRVPTDYELDAKGLERAEFVTANCFCRRAILERLGGFDERFRFAWREDADLYFSLLDIDARVAHVPGAVIVHPIRPAHWGVSLRQQKKILFDALLFKKHPTLYRRKIRAAPRWDYYLIVLALLTLLTGIAAGKPVMAALGGAVWLTLTGRFCAARLRDTAKTPLHVLEMLVTSALIPPLAVFWRIVGMLRFRAAFI
ncbi:MAG TPA: glycosyltransferase family A protein [Paucimonas sp.]|nr:glycosyltransferase family A protein [Paucimonas sp.]